jgi:hypothetical protein
MATTTKRKPRAVAPAKKTRRRTSVAKPARRRRKSMTSSRSGKFDIMNNIAKPAIGYAIGSIASNFIGNMTGIPPFVKPLAPLAGAFVTIMYLKEPMIAAGMAAAAMAATAKMLNIPLLSDPSTSDFPLLADYTSFPILSDGTVLADDMGNQMILADGNMYPQSSVGAYYGAVTI